MAKPASSSIRAGCPPDVHETILQTQEHYDRDMVAPNTYATQHTYPYRRPPSSRSHNGRQPEHYHPQAWQNNSGPVPDHPQSAILVQYNSASMNRTPSFSRRADQQTFDHQTPHLARSHSTRHPSNQMDTNHVTRRPFSPQPPTPRETLPAGITTEQTSSQSIEDGADAIGALVMEEMVKMRAYFEGMIKEIRNQLAREREEKESLRKRVHELETELQQLRISQMAQ